MPADARPSIIDVEASGFGPHSYPIEIGVILDDGSKFCSLIMPAPDWDHWSDDAQQAHQISRDVLATCGKSVNEVTDELNELLDGKILYSDGWVVDQPWLTKLFAAAGKEMLFSISPLEMILSEQQMAIWHETKDRIIEDVELQRHRASHDAWLIQETWRQTRSITSD